MVTTIKPKTKKEEIKKLLSLTKPDYKLLDSSKYSGKIKIKKSPILIQKKLRDEWEGIKKVNKPRRVNQL
jgi:hypothetical protein